MKYEIVRCKGFGIWYVYKRSLFFFREQVNYFMSLKDALEYVGKHSCKIIDEQSRLA